MLKTAAVALLLVLPAGAPPGGGPSEPSPLLTLTTGPSTPPAPSPPELTPEQRMQRRYPQPVKVADLIGLPVLDYDDRTLGRIRTVVRTSNGKIQLIVPYGGFLGFRQRLIAVPIEVVGIAGRQVGALDMDRAAFDAAPAWNDASSRPIPRDEIIRIGLYKR